MKVNIQHSIDLGDVPLKVQELYQDCLAQMNTLTRVSESVSVLNPKDFLSKIDFIRQSLYALDNSLNECANIMTGFMQATESNEHIDHSEMDPATNYPDIPMAEDFKPEIYPGDLDEG